MDRDERPDQSLDGIRQRRARNLTGLLRDLPRESLPAARAEEIRRAALANRALANRVLVLQPLLRVAAAVLVLAGLGAAVLLLSEPRYEPLELTVIDVHANGTHDEDFAFEHIYGPDWDPDWVAGRDAARFVLVAPDGR